MCVGNGAIRYRAALERQGALVPPDEDDVHVPSAAAHALAVRFGPAEEILPLRARPTRRHEPRERRLRRLEQRDLDIVEEIERASYPPWSRSMFAAELRKPSSIAIGATSRRELVGYAFVSRYVDAWHVMNVAVSPTFRETRVASTLLERLFEITAADPRRGYTLEVRVSNAGDSAVRAAWRGPRHPARLLHGQS